MLQALRLVLVPAKATENIVALPVIVDSIAPLLMIKNQQVYRLRRKHL